MVRDTTRLPLSQRLGGRRGHVSSTRCTQSEVRLHVCGGGSIRLLCVCMSIVCGCARAFDARRSYAFTSRACAGGVHMS